LATIPLIAVLVASTLAVGASTSATITAEAQYTDSSKELIKVMNDLSIIG